MATLGLLIACAGGVRVTVAADETLIASGLLDELLARYEESHPGIRVVSTGDRSADLLIDPAVPGSDGDLVFQSQFVLAGPASVEPHSRGLEIPEVLRNVADRGMAFLSPGEGSRTFEVEQTSWLESGLSPVGRPWYTVTGESLLATIQSASDTGAITLCELGLLRASGAALVDLGVVEEGLENPYEATLRSDVGVPPEATMFLDWLLSEDGRMAIVDANMGLFGEVIYDPEVSG